LRGGMRTVDLTDIEEFPDVGFLVPARA
jgi:hypothetical protein